ncbi:MAG TPA: M48 family metallopeptidase [Burkholderiales bacterium]|nr:M48 family metallopeptidase [Burkholderiales bacterium]
MRHALLFILFVAGLSGCASDATTESGAVGVERRQTLLVSSDEVEKAADQQYAQMMAQARQKGLLNRNTAQVQRVRNIVSRLVPATRAFREDALKWDWEVNVISTDELNAWCMPGGKMAIYTGLIEKLNLSDAEIAAVMGHEIAHALREHARERMSRAALTNLGVSLGAAIFGIGDGGTQLGNMVADAVINKPNSRTQETEADAIGVELAARAGYDPNGAVSVWQKMISAGGGGGIEFLSTHPSPENRIKQLQAHAQEVMPLYQAALRR